MSLRNNKQCEEQIRISSFTQVRACAPVHSVRPTQRQVKAFPTKEKKVILDDRKNRKNKTLQQKMKIICFNQLWHSNFWFVQMLGKTKLYLLLKFIDFFYKESPYLCQLSKHQSFSWKKSVNVTIFFLIFLNMDFLKKIDYILPLVTVQNDNIFTFHIQYFF